MQRYEQGGYRPNHEPPHYASLLSPPLPLGPKYLSQHPSLKNSLKVTDQALYPYETTRNITVLCAVIFTFPGVPRI